MELFTKHAKLLEEYTFFSQSEISHSNLAARALL
jgi:hypothetical protein